MLTVEEQETVLKQAKALARRHVHMRPTPKAEG